MSTFDLKAALINDIRNFKAPVLAKKILDQKQEKQLVKLCLDKDALLSSRAMWVLGHCSDMEYDRIKPFHSQLINNLKNENLHNGVIRNTLGLFQKYRVPTKHESFMLDTCYSYIKNATEAIAVRCFAITVVFNISKPYSALLYELEMVLQHLAPTEDGPAMRARIKNTIKAIHKLTLAKK